MLMLKDVFREAIFLKLKKISEPGAALDRKGRGLIACCPFCVSGVCCA